MAMIDRGSALSFDEDHNFITEKIKSCYESDASVSEYFDLLQYSFSNESELYSITVSKQDVATIGDVRSYPPIVVSEAAKAQNRVFFGAFPQISRLYTIIDNKIYIWAEGDVSQISVYVEQGDLITAIACGSPEAKVFNKNVDHVIAIATNKILKLIPVGKSTIYYESSSVVSLKTLVTSICITTKGQIFIGDDEGEINIITYKTDKKDGEIPRIKAINIITPKYLYYTIGFVIPLHRSIKQLAYDETTQFMAVLRDNSTISFYKLEDDKLRYLSADNTYKNVGLVCINSIPISDSLLFRFIAFSQNGDRCFYGPTPGLSDDPDIIRLKQIRYAPQKFRTEDLVIGSFSLSTTVLIYKNCIAVAKPMQQPHSAEKNPKEALVIYELASPLLNFTRDNHILMGMHFDLYKYDMFWQHLISPSPGYLLTVQGYHIINFALPVDKLERLINEYKGNFADPVREWMMENQFSDESSSAAVLLASLKPDMQRWALFIMNQFARLPSQKRNEFDSRLSPPFAAFILRVARLLSGVWRSPLFLQVPKKSDSKTMKWKIASVFGELPPNFIESIRKLIDLGDSFLQIRRASMDSLKTEQQKESAEEAANFYKLSTYLRSIIETLKFIQILREQKSSLIDSTMLLLPPLISFRLSLEFGLSKPDGPSMFSCLREFAAALFTNKDGPKRGDRLSIHIGRECPSFFSEADSLLIEAMEKLDTALNGPLSARPQILEQTRAVFMKHSDRPLKLNDITRLYSQMDYYKGAIDVALCRAHSIDYLHQALLWYKNGCDQEDLIGVTAFNKRYECYECLFSLADIPSAFELMLKTDDELFHICLYSNLVSNDQKERLLSVSTPFLESYLKKNYPQMLYLYDARHGRYADAAIQLYNQAIDPNTSVSLTDRIGWLSSVSTYARSSGLSTLAKDVKILLQCARIQIQFPEQTQAKNLLGQEDIFNLCCQSARWELALELLSFTAVVGVNKKQVISRTWGFWIQKASGLNLAEISMRFLLISQSSGVQNDVFDASILVPIFENLRLSKYGAVAWAVDTFIKSGMSKQLLFEQYYLMYNDKQITDAIKADFCYCSAYLIVNGAKIQDVSLKSMKEWYIQNAKRTLDYEAGFSLMSKFDDNGILI